MNIGEKINIEEVQKGIGRMIHSDIIKWLYAHGMKFYRFGIPRNSYVKMSDSTLRFLVSGLKHSGHVYIRLNCNDNFDIYLTSTRGTIKDIIEDIGIENAFDAMYRRIEE